MITWFFKKKFLVFTVMLFHIASCFAMLEKTLDFVISKGPVALTAFQNVVVPGVAAAYLAKKDLKKQFPSCKITEDKKNKSLAVSTVLSDGTKASQLIVFDGKGHWALPHQVKVHDGSAVIELSHSPSPQSNNPAGDHADALRDKYDLHSNHHTQPPQGGYQDIAAQTVNAAIRSKNYAFHRLDIRLKNPPPPGQYRFTREKVKLIKKQYAQEHGLNPSEIRDIYFDGTKLNHELGQKKKSKIQKAIDFVRGKKDRPRQPTPVTKPISTPGGSTKPPTEDPNKKPEDKNKKNQPITINENRIRDRTKGRTGDHIHENEEHLWNRTGLSREEINDKIIEALNRAASEKKLPKNGLFEIHPTIDGHPVTIRGAVVNGVAETSTAFVVNPTQIAAMNIWKAAQATGKIVLGLGGAALTQQAAAAEPVEMDTSSHNGQETKTASSSSNHSQGFSGKTQQTKARAQGKPSPTVSPSSMDQSADGKKGLGLKKKPEAKNPRSGGPMCGGDGKVTQPLKKLTHRMSFKQVGRLAPTQLEEDEDPNLSDDETGLGLTSQRSSRPGASMSGGDGARAKPRHQGQTSGWFTHRVGEPVTKPYNEDLDENVLLARKFAKKSPGKMNDQEQKFAQDHQGLMQNAQAKMSGNVEDPEIFARKIWAIMRTASHERTLEEDQLLRNNQGLVQELERHAAIERQQREHQAMQESNEEQIIRQREAAMREKQEAIARREAEDRFRREQELRDYLEIIHWKPVHKRSKTENATYNRYAPHIPDLIKEFDDNLNDAIKHVLEKSPKKRTKFENIMIEDYPDRVKVIQKAIQDEEQRKLKKEKKEAAKKEKRWQDRKKNFEKETKNPMLAATLVRLGKSFDDDKSLEKRRDAICQTLDNPHNSEEYPYVIKKIASDYQDVINTFNEFSGSPAQNQVHDELVDAIGDTNTNYIQQYLNPFEVNKNLHIANMTAFLFHFADIARQYNTADKIEQAFALSDFCRDLLAVENVYVSFIKKYEHRFVAGLFSMFETIDAPVEFGKKLNGFVTKYDTKAISTAIKKAGSSLSKALQLTYDDASDFYQKIQAYGPEILQALEQNKTGCKKRLITFVLKRFLHGSALGLKSSQYTKNLLQVLLETIENEQTIEDQADAREKNHPLLAPIITIFEQAIDDALQTAQEKLDQEYEYESSDAEQEMSESDQASGEEDQKAETKKPAKPKGKAPGASSSGSQSSKHGTKRTLAEAQETKGATSMDESVRNSEASNDERIKKRARHKKNAPDGKDAKKPGNTPDLKMPVLFQRDGITQFQSIDQNDYENDPLLNLFGGNLMCGHFSAFNGSCMLDIVNNRRNREKAEQDMISKKAFNTWLGERSEIIEAYEHDAVGNIFGNHIERLLEASGDNFYTDNTSILEIANIRNSFIQRHGEAPLFLPADDALIEQIHYFRESKVPQLVILNTGAHWICMVFGQDWIWFADSLNPDLNQDQEAQADIHQIHDLFTTQPIPAVADLEQLRAQYRDVPKSAAARDEAKHPQLNPTQKMVLKSILKNKKGRSSKK